MWIVTPILPSMVIVSYEMDDAYRAIGRYVVGFSELVRMMRELAAEYVAGGTIGSHLGHMLLGEATAGAPGGSSGP